MTRLDKVVISLSAICSDWWNYWNLSKLTLAQSNSLFRWYRKHFKTKCSWLSAT